jgi:carbon storage regulator CsrA
MIFSSRSRRSDFPWVSPEVTCFVVDVRQDAARLAFRAPRELSVLRKESYDAIQRLRGNGGEDDDDDYTL